MPVDPILVGSNIRRLRENLQTPVEEVSTATGIPEEALSGFEIGQRIPTGDEILILADYFRCDFRALISAEKTGSFDQTDLLFRRYGDDLSKSDRWAIQEFLFLCECEEFLIRRLPGPSRSTFRFNPRNRYYKGDGENAARSLRRSLHYSPRGFPQNAYQDFRRIGIHVFRRQLANSSISGLYINHPWAGKCVLVNYNEDVYRQRFTVAHEVAHAVLNDQNGIVVSFANLSLSNPDLVEIRANTFASRYLIPPEALPSLPPAFRWTEETVVEWMHRLKVNAEPLAHALKDAGIISEEIETWMESIKVPTETKSDPELPGDLSPNSRIRREHLLRKGLSVFYVDLCFLGYRQGLVSSGRLAEMLLIDASELAELADTYGVVLSYGA